jgi:hypothetical protein
MEDRMTINMTKCGTSGNGVNAATNMQSVCIRMYCDGEPVMTIGDKDAADFRAFWSGACVCAEKSGNLS